MSKGDIVPTHARTHEQYNGHSDYHSEVYFKNGQDTHTEVFICIEAGDAHKMGYTAEDAAEVVQKEVITGVTGSEWLITEKRDHYYINITNDDRWYISINKVYTGDHSTEYDLEEVNYAPSEIDFNAF